MGGKKQPKYGKGPSVKKAKSICYRNQGGRYGKGNLKESLAIQKHGKNSSVRAYRKTGHLAIIKDEIFDRKMCSNRKKKKEKTKIISKNKQDVKI